MPCKQGVREGCEPQLQGSTPRLARSRTHLVRGRETALLDHLVLVLDEELDTLNGGSSRLGDGGGDTTCTNEKSEEVSVGVLLIICHASHTANSPIMKSVTNPEAVLVPCLAGSATVPILSVRVKKKELCQDTKSSQHMEIEQRRQLPQAVRRKRYASELLQKLDALSLLNVEAICDTHIKVSGGREEEVGKEREKEMLRWLVFRPRPPAPTEKIARRAASSGRESCSKGPSPGPDRR